MSEFSKSKFVDAYILMQEDPACGIDSNSGIPIGIAVTEEDAKEMLETKYDRADFYIRVPVAFPDKYQVFEEISQKMES